MSKRFYQTLTVVMALLVLGVGSAMAASVKPYMIGQVSGPGGAIAECKAVGDYNCAFKVEGAAPNGDYTATCYGWRCRSFNYYNHLKQHWRGF